mmetsp:Transcript_92248/g.296577  ORF Transcript_92248/g.296577 Transcript_92248/m.296577 type:complete len:448 (+) Transcript_92248:193-1536(+)
MQAASCHCVQSTLCTLDDDAPNGHLARLRHRNHLPRRVGRQPHFVLRDLYIELGRLGPLGPLGHLDLFLLEPVLVVAEARGALAQQHLEGLGELLEETFEEVAALLRGHGLQVGERALKLLHDLADDPLLQRLHPLEEVLDDHHARTFSRCACADQLALLDVVAVLGPGARARGRQVRHEPRLAQRRRLEDALDLARDFVDQCNHALHPLDHPGHRREEAVCHLAHRIQHLDGRVGTRAGLHEHLHKLGVLGEAQLREHIHDELLRDLLQVDKLQEFTDPVLEFGRGFHDLHELAHRLDDCLDVLLARFLELVQVLPKGFVGILNALHHTPLLLEQPAEHLVRVLVSAAGLVELQEEGHPQLQNPAELLHSVLGLLQGGAQHAEGAAHHLLVLLRDLLVLLADAGGPPKAIYGLVEEPVHVARRVHQERLQVGVHVLLGLLHGRLDL